MAASAEEEEFDRGREANLLARALERMRAEEGPPYERALRLHREGEEYEAIACRLGAGVSTVASWIRRARLRLREQAEREIREYRSLAGEGAHESNCLLRKMSEGP